MQLTFKGLFSAIFARWMIPPEVDKQAFDIVIGFSPAVATYGLVKRLKKRAGGSVLIYWDFFPVHQAQLGTIPNNRLFLALAHFCETRAVCQFDQVGCMSPRNQEFFRRYFPRFRGPLQVVPIWGPPSVAAELDRPSLRAQHDFADDDIVCVFGGQLVPGRDIEGLCELALSSAKHAPNLKFVIAGSGPLEALVKRRAAESGGRLIFAGLLSREEYVELLGCADIGLVFTPGHVSVPTFPSKVIDYCRSGLPVLASTEAATDFGIILQDEMRAGLACEASDHDGKIRALSRLANSDRYRRECGERGREYYMKNMTADVIADQLISMFSINMV
jgi:glycosyltransferase involved in cell wall biosynthesis